MDRAVCQSKFSGSSSRDMASLTVLVLIAATFYAIFYFPGFVAPDEVRYGMGFWDLSQKGKEPFNYEMSFGYYLMLKPLLSGLSNDLIPLVLNGLSSLAGTVLLIPLYFFIKALSNPRIALATGLFLVFSPSFWLLTRYGHPAPLALVFFYGSMALFNRALQSTGAKKRIGLGWSIILSLCALLMRADILLSLLVPIGIVLFKKDRWPKDLPLLFSYYGLTLTAYIVLKWFLLGYLFHPTGGTVAFNLTKIPSIQFVAKSLVKNTALFIIGFLPLPAMCLVLSVWNLFRTQQWRVLVLIGLWVFPTTLFLPFWGMDFSRLYVPVLPPLLFAVIYWIDGFSFTRFKWALLIVTLIAAPVSLIAFNPLLTKYYPFKTYYQNKPISMIPIESVFSDYYFRRDYLENQQKVARQSIRPTDRNVVIISDGHHLPWYEYELRRGRQTFCHNAPEIAQGIDWLICPSAQNVFYIGVVEWHTNPETINTLVDVLGRSFDNSLFHVNPFLAELPQRTLFIGKKEFLSSLKNNPAFVNRYREIFNFSHISPNLPK